MAKELEVKVPDLGDYKDVPVIEILVKDGDRVEKDTALITLESEKATMEVPSPAAGVVRGIRAKVGGKVNVGDVILTLEESGAPPQAEKPKEPAAQQAKPQPAKSTPAAEPAPREAEEKPPARPSAGPSRMEVTVPDIGDYENVPVIEVLVKDGDAVEKDAPLLVLESEKATMEVPSPAKGTVSGLKIKAGAKVSKGDPICTLEITGGEQEVPATAGKPKPSADIGPKEEQVPPPKQSAPSPPRGGEGHGEGMNALPPWVGQAQVEIPHASPAVRKLAREFGVDLRRVSGSGPKGRILQEDVQSYTKKALQASSPSSGEGQGGGALPRIPAVDFKQFGEIETKPLGRIRKISAQHLHRAWLNVPHVTQNDEADITELEAFRKSQSEEAAKEGGPKLTLLPFIMKAVSVALKQFPEFNSSLAPDGENLILKKYCHIGFAADTPNGLVVPVVKDVWSKGIVQLAVECGELASRARDGKLKPDEMKGGCFSISSLGGIGGTHFTPIVNAPEVAILGVSRAVMKPVWNGKEFVPRLMCPLSLSYDHRVIDGAYAARFIVHLVKLLTDLRRAVL